MCVFSQIKDKKHIEQDFYSVAKGGIWRSKGFKFFFQHSHVAYQINADDDYNRMQVNFSPLGQTGDLEVGSKIFSRSGEIMVGLVCELLT